MDTNERSVFTAWSATFGCNFNTLVQGTREILTRLSNSEIRPLAFGFTEIGSSSGMNFFTFEEEQCDDGIVFIVTLIHWISEKKQEVKKKVGAFCVYRDNAERTCLKLLCPLQASYLQTDAAVKIADHIANEARGRNIPVDIYPLPTDRMRRLTVSTTIDELFEFLRIFNNQYRAFGYYFEVPKQKEANAKETSFYILKTDGSPPELIESDSHGLRKEVGGVECHQFGDRVQMQVYAPGRAERSYFWAYIKTLQRELQTIGWLISTEAGVPTGPKFGRDIRSMETGTLTNEITSKQKGPTIGIVTALEKEFAAVKALLDNKEDRTISGRGAGRRYCLGEVPSVDSHKHLVVLALADMGNNAATTRATLLLQHFPTIDYIIMVGIAGGVPHPDKPDEHVRLGDVVVSNQKGVIQYDFFTENAENKITYRHSPRPPSATLLEGVRLLRAAELKGQRPWDIFIKQAGNELNIARPPEETDTLVSSTDPKARLSHPPDSDRNKPEIFHGPIAAANILLKNPVRRDELRDQFGVKAIEMESSGIADATWNSEIGYLVIRGICDYCDSRKNDDWQGYASVAAAAYTRALLESIPYAALGGEKNPSTKSPLVESISRPAIHELSVEPMLISFSKGNRQAFTSEFLHWSQCTIVLWVCVPPMGERLRDAPDYRYLLAHQKPENGPPNRNKFGLCYTPDRRWQVEITNNAGTWERVGFLDKLEPGWHHFLIGWNHTDPKLAFCIDKGQGGSDYTETYRAKWPEERHKAAYIGAWMAENPYESSYCETEVFNLQIWKRFLELTDPIVSEDFAAMINWAADHSG